MENTGGIKGLGSATGSRSSSSSSPGYVYLPPHHAAKHQALRKGEIVHGTILDANGTEAVVRLPNGDFSAYLSGKLKKNDSLFFKVLESDTRLVLKIFAVLTKINGQSLKDTEMLRILDIPESEFNLELIRFLRSRRTIINRDEYLSIYKNFIELPDSEVRRTSKHNLLRTLFYINENSITFSPELFAKIKNAFSGTPEFYDFFSRLTLLSTKFPQSITSEIGRFYEKIMKLETNLFSILSFLGSNTLFAHQENDLLNLLLHIIPFAKKSPAGSEMYDFGVFCEDLLDSVEAQYALDAIAQQWNSPVYYFLPVGIRGKAKLAKIILKKMRTPGHSSELLKFSFEIFSAEYGEIVANVSYLNKQISVGLFSDKEIALNFLKEYIKILESSIRVQGFTIKSLTVNQTSEEILDTINELSGQSGAKISVVI